MSAGSGEGTGGDSIARWLPIITGAVVGAGILTLLYVFKPESEKKAPEMEKEKEELEPRTSKNRSTYCAKQQQFTKTADGCLRIDLRKKRWLTKEEEQELQSLEQGMNEELCELQRKLEECEQKRLEEICEFRRRQRMCQERMQERLEQARERTLADDDCAPQPPDCDD